MTVQEAIHCMKFVTEEEVCEKCPIYGETGTDHCFADAHRLAIQALEKQIPKKVVFEDGGESLLCPSCGLELMGSITAPDHDPYYCFECGQALDWSE